MQVIAAVVTFFAVYFYVLLSKPQQQSNIPTYPYQSGIDLLALFALLIGLANSAILFLMWRKLKATPTDAVAAKAKRKADLLKQLRDLEHDNTNTEITPETPPPPPPPPPTKRKVKERKP